MSLLQTTIDVARRAVPLVPVMFCIDNYVGTVKLVSGCSALHACLIAVLQTEALSSQVGGRSMQPTFNSRGLGHNDAVVLDRWSAKRFDFQRGDVVVLRSPHDPAELLTKRVVGLPGDSVQPRPGASGGSVKTHVPRGMLWVEGDNERSSNDSNSFGVIAVSLVEARVSYKLWPPNEAGRVARRELAPERLLSRAPCESAADAISKSCGQLPWHLPRH